MFCAQIPFSRSISPFLEHLRSYIVLQAWELAVNVLSSFDSYLWRMSQYNRSLVMPSGPVELQTDNIIRRLFYLGKPNIGAGVTVLAELQTTSNFNRDSNYYGIATTLTTYGTTIKGIVFFWGALNICSLCFLMAYTVIYRQSPVFKAATFSFCICIEIGLVILAACGLMFVIEPTG